MIVSLFEDETYENFLPLTYTKPVFQLKSGIFSFLRRAQKVFPDYLLLLLIPAALKSDASRATMPKHPEEDIELLKKLFRLTPKKRERQELLNAGLSYSYSS